MVRVRRLVDICGILSPLPIIRINTEHLVFTPDAFFIAAVRMTIHLSASHIVKGVSELTDPLKAFSIAVIAQNFSMLLSAFPFGFFKNPASKTVCGIIELCRR